MLFDLEWYVCVVVCINGDDFIYVVVEDEFVVEYWYMGFG